jgi:hypothetical protein
MASQTAEMGSCIDCLFGVADGGTMPTNEGAIEFDSTYSTFFNANYAGCISLEGDTACGQAYFPADQCDFVACYNNTACTASNIQASCLTPANGTGGACASEVTAVQGACTAAFGDGGVANGGKCTTAADVFNVFCGTGP